MGRLNSYVWATIATAAFIVLAAAATLGGDPELGPAVTVGLGWVVGSWLSVAYTMRGAERAFSLEELFVGPAVVFLAPSTAIMTAAVVGVVVSVLHATMGDGVARLPKSPARLGFRACQVVVPAAPAAVAASVAGGPVVAAVVGVVVFSLTSALICAPAYAMVDGRKFAWALADVLRANVVLQLMGWLGGVAMVLGAQDLSLPPLVAVAVAVLVVWWWLGRRLHYAETVNTALLGLASRAVDATSQEELDRIVREVGPQAVNRPMWLSKGEPSGSAELAVPLPGADPIWMCAGAPPSGSRQPDPYTRRAVSALAALLGAATAAVAAREAVAHQATHDGLTGLLNRLGMHAVAERVLARAGSDGSSCTVAYVDLNRFKAVNDTYGHESGDDVLRAVAAGLQRGLRPTDLAGRLGGDEFVVLFPGGVSSATAVERIDAALDDLPYGVSGSVGVAQMPDDGDSLEELLRSADRRMYAAKGSARVTLTADAEA